MVAIMIGHATVAAAEEAPPETVYRNGQARYNVRTFDIAGVRLGMTYSEAEEALVKAGYPETWDDQLVDTFEQKVRDAVSVRTGVRPSQDREQARGGTIGSTLPTGERVTVRFAATPDGIRVSEVKFLLSKDRMDPSVFEGLAVEKYGKESYAHSGQLEHRWCSVDEENCHAQKFKSAPSLSTGTFVQNSLTLSEGTKFWNNLKDAERQALEARSPKARSATF